MVQGFIVSYAKHRQLKPKVVPGSISKRARKCSGSVNAITTRRIRVKIDTGMSKNIHTRRKKRGREK